LTEFLYPALRADERSSIAECLRPQTLPTEQGLFV
jgi:hypothetical protein